MNKRVFEKNNTNRSVKVRHPSYAKEVVSATS